MFVLFCTLVVSLPLSAAEHIKPFIMPSARAAGFGGIHAAQGDDFSSLFSNPASFVDIEKEFSAAELSFTMYGPVFEILDLLVSEGDSTDISSLVEPGGFSAGVEVGGPLSLGYVGNGLGMGVFSRAVMDVTANSSRFRPVGSGEILFLGGYSMRALEKDVHKLDLGFVAKGFYRGSIDMESSIFDITEAFDDISSNAYQAQFGVGLDLGAKYTWNNTFSAALVAYDAFSPALVTGYDSFKHRKSGKQHYATVTPRLAVGGLYRVQSDFLARYIDDLVLMFDYRDLLDYAVAEIPRNPVLQVSLGAEVRFLKILSLRAGMAEALPAVGFGLDMTILKFDVAVRGKELGLDPGVQSVYTIDIGLLFRY
jgi:hypothetical protein